MVDNAHVKWNATRKEYKFFVCILVIEDLNVNCFFKGLCQHQQDYPTTHTFVVSILTQKLCKGMLKHVHNTMKDVET